MPNYDYRCPACRTQFESFAWSAKRNKVRCRACGAKAIQLISAPNVRATKIVLTDPDTGHLVEYGSKAKAAEVLERRGHFSDGINHLYGSGEHAPVGPEGPRIGTYEAKAEEKEFQEVWNRAERMDMEQHAITVKG